MSEDVLSLLCRAIHTRSEVSILVFGMSETVQPHVVYNSPAGVPTVALVNVAFNVFGHIPITEIKAVTLTGRTFDPHPGFDRLDPRYNGAFAIIEGI